jgi:hypothetical protein
MPGNVLGPRVRRRSAPPRGRFELAQSDASMWMLLTKIPDAVTRPIRHPVADDNDLKLLRRQVWRNRDSSNCSRRSFRLCVGTTIEIRTGMLKRVRKLAIVRAEYVSSRAFRRGQTMVPCEMPTMRVNHPTLCHVSHETTLWINLLCGSAFCPNTLGRVCPGRSRSCPRGRVPCRRLGSIESPFSRSGGICAHILK